MVRADEHPLLGQKRPEFESGTAVLRLADLFCGCGGITLGIAQAARRADLALDIAVAVDTDPEASAVYAANFPKANLLTQGVDEIFQPMPGMTISESEAEVAAEIGTVTALVGGPPCQGHSDLNNHTRRRDPKNALYAYMARAAEVLQPRVVLIENVPTVQHDRDGVLDRTRRSLSAIGFDVADAVVPLVRLGVA